MKISLFAGGRGTRLGTVEKPLLPVTGTPMIEHVLHAIDTSDHGELSEICLSPNTPRTLDRFENHPSLRKTPGNGYHEDLATLLTDIDEPRLVLPCDLPLLTPEILDTTAETFHHLQTPISIVVTTTYKRQFGLSTSQKPLEYAGINVLHPTPDPQPEERILLDRPGTACNVNTPRDLEITRKLAP